MRAIGSGSVGWSISHPGSESEDVFRVDGNADGGAGGGTFHFHVIWLDTGRPFQFTVSGGRLAVESQLELRAELFAQHGMPPPRPERPDGRLEELWRARAEEAGRLPFKWADVHPPSIAELEALMWLVGAPTGPAPDMATDLRRMVTIGLARRTDVRDFELTPLGLAYLERATRA